MAIGSGVPEGCVTTSVLPVITTTICSGGSPAVPTGFMPIGHGNVPDQYSQPASGPSAVDSGSVPHVSISYGSADSPSAGTHENPTNESDGPQSGAGAPAGDSNGTAEVVKPNQTTVPGVGAQASASSGSEPKANASGQPSPITGQEGTAPGTTSETSETPADAPEIVSGASSSVTNIKVNAMIMAAVVACFAPMMVPL